MLQKDQRAQQERRNSGRAQDPHAKLPTYQDLLDEALDDTFPASDPVATGAATRVHEPHTTARDCQDWTLKPEHQASKAGDRSERREAWLAEPLSLGGLVIPSGACQIEQTEDAAVLCWREAGDPRHADIDLDALRQLLADGRLQRLEPR